MNARYQRGFGPVALIAAALLAALPAAAHTSQARVSKGTVEAVDLDSGTVKIRSLSEVTSIELSLPERVKFVRDRKFVQPAVIKLGTQVTFYYRTPFFGRPFLTKAVWIERER
jgi:hypothetical protein